MGFRGKTPSRLLPPLIQSCQIYVPFVRVRANLAWAARSGAPSNKGVLLTR
jgi:hypothetical protein